MAPVQVNKNPIERGHPIATTTQGAAIAEARDYSVWHIDPAHSLAEFSVRHMMVTNVRGQLAHDGRSNQEIGELFIGPKTVEYHLHNAFTKLVTKSRHQLKRVLRRD